MLSSVLGLLVGILCEACGYFDGLGTILEALSAVCCAFLMRLFIDYVHPACFMSTVLAGTIWLLPGSYTKEKAQTVT